MAGNRKFESISLQERVHCELDHRRRDRPALLGVPADKAVDFREMGAE